MKCGRNSSFVSPFIKLVTYLIVQHGRQRMTNKFKTIEKNRILHSNMQYMETSVILSKLQFISIHFITLNKIFCVCACILIIIVIIIIILDKIKKKIIAGIYN